MKSNASYSLGKHIFYICIFICVNFLSIVFGCSRRENLIVDVSDSVSFSPDFDWAVISVQYAVYCTNPGVETDISAHGRKNDVLQILGRRIVHSEEKKVLWYKFQQGWLPESAVRVYQNKMQAERVSTSTF